MRRHILFWTAFGVVYFGIGNGLIPHRVPALTAAFGNASVEYSARTRRFIPGIY